MLVVVHGPSSTTDALPFFNGRQIFASGLLLARSGFFFEELQWSGVENGTHAVYASDFTTVDKLSFVLAAIFRSDIPPSCNARSFFMYHFHPWPSEYLPRRQKHSY